jgi:hypothetical protein
LEQYRARSGEVTLLYEELTASDELASSRDSPKHRNLIWFEGLGRLPGRGFTRLGGGLQFYFTRPPVTDDTQQY